MMEPDSATRERLLPHQDGKDDYSGDGGSATRCGTSGGGGAAGDEPGLHAGNSSALELWTGSKTSFCESGVRGERPYLTAPLLPLLPPGLRAG